MKAKNHGHIITIASVFGHFSTACSSKPTFKLLILQRWGFMSLWPMNCRQKRTWMKTTLVCPYIVDSGMFAGSRNREETELILPPLQPLYCVVQQAMNAILTDQPLVPFPWEYNAVMCHFLGLDKCMYPFTKTMRKKRAANGAIKAA
uniref:Retinol dehydrogenase 20 n=1 Tax=Sinocyclocheilus anshuiensis TaxID=1608454 RepID=A0A671PCL5_9TELE